MRKSILALLSCLAFAVEGFAQKGMQAVGAYVPIGTYTGSVWSGIGARYQYNLSDYLRLSPSVSWGILINDNISPSRFGDVDKYYVGFSAFADLHVFVTSIESVRPYIVAGIGYFGWSHKNLGGESNSYNVGVNFGLGLDWRINQKFELQAEATPLLFISWTEPILKGGISFLYNF